MCNRHLLEIKSLVGAENFRNSKLCRSMNTMYIRTYIYTLNCSKNATNDIVMILCTITTINIALYEKNEMRKCETSYKCTVW